MNQKYIYHVAEKLKLNTHQILNVVQLSEEGATIPFMARYRKEATNNMDEVAIAAVLEEDTYFKELDKRKETILKTIEEQGKLTSELKKKIEDSISSTELEDLYLPYKPKRKTKALTAIEKGLEPLAQQLFSLSKVNPEEEALKYVNDQVRDVKEALQGARDIIAEWVSENQEARNAIRHLFEKNAELSSKAVTSKKEEVEAQKYRDYFDFSEPLSRIPSHRMLAIRRGEKEGYLMMDINISKESAIESLNDIFITSSVPSTTELKKAIEESYQRLMKPSIENEFRLLGKTKADEEAISVFAENLRQLLLSSPLGSKRILAIDPGYRTGCKIVCLDEQGTLLFNTAIFPHPPQNQWQESIAEIKRLVSTYELSAIAVGNGTAGRESEQLVRSIDFGKTVSIFQVNESGASIYSASEVAREEFPDKDVTVRGAVSIGRRLLDPLSELVKIDPKSIGVGQYQHDVNQVKLKQSLDRVVESAVNFVGVNVNTASRHLLQYVSGISGTLASHIVKWRTENGAFASREDLKKVPLMGPKTFEQCAGFLRIPSSQNPLDNSAVHPERYVIVQKMADDLQVSLEELIKKAELRKNIKKEKYISENVGAYTIEDILKELEKPGRDPREPISEFHFDETIKSIEDVKVGMKVPGIVTNITNFGAFVDIGVKQDCLVHLSQLSNRYITDPNEVVKLNQKVIVTVTEVDVARKRIGLTMKENLPATTNTKFSEVKKERNVPVKNTPAKPLNAFQSKLSEIRKKLDQ
jgi:Transcriptional accessory protein